MLCAPSDTLAKLKWKGREEGAVEGRKWRAKADLEAGMGAIASQKSGKKF